MDPFVSCPYNLQHRVPRSRIQQHIVKCEEKYPKLEICPYNATHRFPEDKIKAHIVNCPSREQFCLEDKPATTNALITRPEPVQVDWHSDEESWDV